MEHLIFKSSDSIFGLKVHSSLFEQILTECRSAKRNETGGLMIGRYTPELDLAIVSKITGPPQDSKAGFSWFYRGVAGLKTLLQKMWETERLHFVGEWHFHPFSSPAPSSTDFNQMKAIANDSKWQCKEPLLLIVGGDPSGDWKVSVHVCRADGSATELVQTS